MEKPEIGGVLCAHPRTYIDVSQPETSKCVRACLALKKENVGGRRCSCKKEKGGGEEGQPLYIYM